MKILNVGDKLFYARIFPSTGTYDVCDLTIRTVKDDYFVGVDKRDKHAYLFGYNALDEYVFDNRDIAFKKVQNAEKNKKDIDEETYYEEY